MLSLRSKSRSLLSKKISFILTSLVSLSIFFSTSVAHAQVTKPIEITKWFLYSPGDSVDNFWPVPYTPDQPIPFSHKKHAGELKIQCKYCHSNAYHSASAGVPPMNTCMGCHTYVATNSESIKYLTQKYNDNEPIEWVKVHDLPDFVRFSHKPHMKAGLKCQECHGEVEKMEVVGQHAPLQMGWCLNCHVKKDAPMKCLTCHH